MQTNLPFPWNMDVNNSDIESEIDSTEPLKLKIRCKLSVKKAAFISKVNNVKGKFRKADEPFRVETDIPWFVPLVLEISTDGSEADASELFESPRKLSVWKAAAQKKWADFKNEMRTKYDMDAKQESYERMSHNVGEFLIYVIAGPKHDIPLHYRK